MPLPKRLSGSTSVHKCHLYVTSKIAFSADNPSIEVMQVNLLESKTQKGDGQEPSVEQTDLISLVKHQDRVEANTLLGKMYQHFQSHQHDFCAVMDAAKWWGCALADMWVF